MIYSDNDRFLLRNIFDNVTKSLDKNICKIFLRIYHRIEEIEVCSRSLLANKLLTICIVQGPEKLKDFWLYLIFSRYMSNL